MLLFTSAAPAAEDQSVLVLYSHHRLLPENLEFEAALRETLPNSTQLSAEFLDYPRFDGDAYMRALTRFLREKYALRPPDVLVVGAQGALDFVLRHRAELFPRVPVIHAVVPRSYLQSRPPLPADVVGIPVEYDFPGTIELALRWHPRARRLLVVTGASAQDQGWEAALRADVSRFHDRVTVEFLAGLPTDALLQRLRALGKDTVVFTPGYFEDGVDHEFSPREAAQLIASAAAAPVYGPFDTFIGTGIVGGSMPDFAAMGRQAGRLVNERLAGGAPAAPPLTETMPKAVNVDWRQIQRWDIDPSEIPDDAILSFKSPTLLEQYAAETLAATVVLLLQAGLIAGLLFERRRRRRMEQGRPSTALRARPCLAASGRRGVDGRHRPRDQPAPRRDFEQRRCR